MKFFKNRKTMLLISAIGLSMLAQNALADTTDTSPENTDALIKNITAQTQQLEQQVNALKKQVRELKQQQQQVKKEEDKTSSSLVRVLPTMSANVAATAPAKTSAGKPLDTYVSGTPVVVAPYVGEHTAFNAQDLVVNYSDYNEDLTLLQLRRDVLNQYTQEGLSSPNSATLMLSGKIETQLNYLQPYIGSHQSSVNLSGAELDIVPVINNWASGLVTLNYDNTINPAAPGAPRTSNSRIYVDRGFLTFGDLNRLPVYLTVGQMYVPFGHYVSSMIDNSIPQDIFQTRARALLAGYQYSDNNGPYAQAYAFNGDSSTNTNTSNVNNLGTNVGFKFDNGVITSDLGAGVITNIADSLGMQDNGLPTGFKGFSSTTPTSDILYRQVPGAAVSYVGSIKQGSNSYNLIGEYVTAMSPFATQDMTFDGHGAKPQAFNAELAYGFHVWTKPAAFSIGYGGSRDALALNVPEKRYIATFNTSVWKDTIEEIEFRHDINYSASDTASGAGTGFSSPGLGNTENSVLAQVGIYF